MKLHIPQQVYDKVMHWVNKTNIEVSGFGTVEYDQATQTFTVTDAFLLKQTGGAAHTDIDAASLSSLDERLEDQGIVNGLHWWWHSHVKMDTFWSGTDIDTIKTLGKDGWITASVFNQHSKVKSAACYSSKTDFGGTLVHINEDIPTIITSEVDPELVARWDAEFTENVQEKKYVAPIASTPSMFGNGSREYYDQYDWYKEHYGSGPSKRYTVHDTYGLAGYPIKEEAKVLNLGTMEYVQKLNDNNLVELYKLEDKLFIAASKGAFHEVK